MSFKSDIDKIIAKTTDRLKKTVEGVRIEMSERVINRTPVDTGYARGNWQASIDYPIKSEITRFDTIAGFAPTDGDGISLRAASKVAEKDYDKTFFLTNSVPYIRNLEYFSGSNQAPHGMVRITVAEFEDILNEVLRGLK